MPDICTFHLMLFIYSAVFFLSKTKIIQKSRQVMVPPGRGGFFHLFGGGGVFVCFVCCWFFKYTKHTFNIKARKKYSLHFPRHSIGFVTAA